MSKKFIIAHSVAAEGTSETHYGYTGLVDSKHQVVAEIQDDLAEIELAVGRVKPYEEKQKEVSTETKEVKTAKEAKAPKEEKVAKAPEASKEVVETKKVGLEGLVDKLEATTNW